MVHNYKTTLLGALAAASNLLANHLLTAEGSINWPALAVSFCLFFLGAFASDHDKVQSK